MSDLQQQVESQQNEMRNAAAEAAHSDQLNHSLKLTLSKERAEREQASSAMQKQQWVDSQKAAERLANLEANVQQHERSVEQAASAEVQSAYDMFNQESQSWINSEQHASSQYASEAIQRTQAEQYEREQALIITMRQEAMQLHDQRVGGLTLEASMNFHAQEVRTRALQDELVRLQAELARGVADRVSANFIDDPQGAIIALQQELSASESWTIREEQLCSELREYNDKLD